MKKITIKIPFTGTASIQIKKYYFVVNHSAIILIMLLFILQHRNTQIVRTLNSEKRALAFFYRSHNDERKVTDDKAARKTKKYCQENSPHDYDASGLPQ
jgi:hypothetical protein